MLASGLLYDTLVHGHVEALQVVFWELSPAGETYMNGQFRARQETFNQLRRANNPLLWATSAKPEAVRLADFWDAKLKEHRARLDEIAQAVDQA